VKVGLVVHAERRQAHEVARKLVAEARRRGMELVTRAQEAEWLQVGSADLSAPGLDVLMAIGGDGTVLEAVELALQADAPVVGINVGRLGFLAEVEPSELEGVLDALAAGDWQESLRTTVQARLRGGRPVVGVNDVVVDKSFNPRTVALSIEVDERHFITYYADGVVVATPTGSTAYNYSAGGPLVDPELPALVLTAVAPHSLFTRSMVFPATRGLRVTVQGDRTAGLAVDGRPVASLGPGDWVDVSAGPTPARFVRIGPRGFAERVAGKLGVGDA
jgi:NAD+ kinase